MHSPYGKPSGRRPFYCHGTQGNRHFCTVEAIAETATPKAQGLPTLLGRASPSGHTGVWDQPSRGGEEQGPHAAVGPEGTESWPCSVPRTRSTAWHLPAGSGLSYRPRPHPHVPPRNCSQQVIVRRRSAVLVCAAMPAASRCSQFNQWLSLAVPQKADKTSQLQTQPSASPYTGTQVATREPTQCPDRGHSSPQLTGSEEGNGSAGLGSGGRRLLLTACLPVYTGSGKPVNFSHGGDKWKNQNAREWQPGKQPQNNFLKQSRRLWVRGRTLLGSQAQQRGQHVLSCPSKNTQ